MALFNKLFFTSSSKKKNQNSDQPQQYLSHFPFESHQVRILLYRECDTRGRRLLFDSSSIQKISLTENVEENQYSQTKSSSGARMKNSCKLPKSAAGFIEISDGFGYKHNRPSTTDITSIGEMIFGALAMSFRGTALKVHWLQSPARVLCSQVFLSPVHTNNFSNKLSTNSLSSSSGQISDQSSLDTSSINSFSMPFSVCVNDNLNLIAENIVINPLDVPPMGCGDSKVDSSVSGRLCSINSAGDSGISGTDPWTASNSSYCQYSTRSSLGSVFGDNESFRKLSVDSASIADDYKMTTTGFNKASDGSLQRRISRNISTSFENRNSMSDFIGFIGDNQQTATNGGSDSCIPRYRLPSDNSESRSNPEMIRKKGTSGDTLLRPNNTGGHGRHLTKRAKLGLAVCITLSETYEKEMEKFCSEHITLLESMLCRLRASAENAYINHKNFLQIMVHAWRVTTRWIIDLFSAPRLSYPIWLTLSGGRYKNSKNLADSFMNELCWLLSFADTKDTNFFISTMLTAILTNHLGWVTTISSFNTKTKSIAADVNAHRAKLKEVARKHPYNAIWAQMGDLYGAIGNPPKISRTIVYGSERRTIDKVLNILTYFIRCAEVKRVEKTEHFDKNLLEQFFNETSQKTNNNNNNKSDYTPISPKSSFSKMGGLSRTQTCTKNLSDICIKPQDDDNDDDAQNEISGLVETKHVMNDIPNVLAFRDSHFVQQELRIGNFLMDTGIEMNPKQKMDLKSYQIKEKVPYLSNCNEQLPYTPNPNQIEEILGAVKAIEIDQTPNVDKISNDCFTKTKFPWSIEPPVKEGLSWDDLDRLQKGIQLINEKASVILPHNKYSVDPQSNHQNIWKKFMKRSNSLISNSRDEVDSTLNFLCNKKSNFHESQSAKADVHHTSLSDLITANSVGQSERFTWGIERVKETISPEEEQHFELSKKIVEKDRELKAEQFSNISGSGAAGVVFVLGDNEALVNIKKSTEDIPKLHDNHNTIISSSSSSSTSALSPSSNNNDTTNKRRHTCNHKKHSGVKFNFEQYPQIATNYMKNKNLDISNYNFLEKSTKFDGIFNYGPSTSAFPVLNKPGGIETTTATSTDQQECEFCAGAGERILQTPSNATELEFGTDDNYPTIASCSNLLKQPERIVSSGMDTGNHSHDDSNIQNDNKMVVPSLKIEKVKSDFNLFRIPIPDDRSNEVVENLQHNETGLIPSLFAGISDHYIPDMVLQGTTASPELWEMTLKQDLALAAHCATLIPVPTENVAVVANVDKWDVKTVSSQSYMIPYASNATGAVGMSQLVSSMLETVHAMSDSGISAYECMSFLESKLHEMYLQSEALAAFLLATEFCSLNTVTSALNLSANDVPLLLSVASIHSPQVTKKYGVSSR